MIAYITKCNVVQSYILSTAFQDDCGSVRIHSYTIDKPHDELRTIDQSLYTTFAGRYGLQASWRTRVYKTNRSIKAEGPGPKDGLIKRLLHFLS